MPFEERSPGLLLITYAAGEELAAARQSALVARLEEARGPVALVFDVQPTVREVPIDVPTFWLGVTARPELQIRAMAIASRVTLVRVAARGFALANVARGLDLAVDTFSELEPALAWAAERLAR
ncbi:MAG: hypothetical protein ACOZQL_32535 [Myxococcota bacterium]